MTDGRRRSDRIELEEKLAYLEKMVLDLNDALVAQSRTVTDLCRRVEALERVVRGVTQELAADRSGPANEKPPHY